MIMDDSKHYKIDIKIDDDDNLLKITTRAKDKMINRIIDSIEAELNVNPIQIEWQSIHSKYVTYDEEPYDNTGFYLIRTYEINHKTLFLKYLLENKFNNLNTLEACNAREGYTDGKHTETSVKVQ